MTTYRTGALVAATVTLASVLSSQDEHDRPGVDHISGADTCEVVAHQPQRMVLSDGRRITINATSAVASGDSLFVVGSDLHIFPSTPGSGRAVPNAPFLGVVRDERGRLTLVPSPLPGRLVKEPQLAAARNGGWHAVFVAGESGTPWHAFAYDTAEIWYGRYTGERWEDVQLISKVRMAVLSLGYASAPVEVGGRVAFAFPFDLSWQRQSNAAGNQGAVVLRPHGQVWLADTLRTWASPRSVQLSVDGKGRLRAYISAEYFERPDIRGPALFTASFDSSWTEPTLLYEPSPEDLAELLEPIPKGGADLLSWKVAPPGADYLRLEWGIVRGDTLRRMSTITDVRSIDRPAVVPIDGRTTLWLTRNGDDSTRLRVFVADDSVARPAGVVPAPLLNFVTVAARMPSGTVVAATGGHDPTAAAGPPFVSYLTELAVRCPAAQK